MLFDAWPPKARIIPLGRSASYMFNTVLIQKNYDIIIMLNRSIFKNNLEAKFFEIKSVTYVIICWNPTKEHVHSYFINWIAYVSGLQLIMIRLHPRCFNSLKQPTQHASNSTDDPILYTHVLTLIIKYTQYIQSKINLHNNF